MHGYEPGVYHVIGGKTVNNHFHAGVMQAVRGSTLMIDVASILDKIERKVDEANEEKREANAWQDTRDEAIQELDAIKSNVDSLRDDVSDLLDTLDPDSAEYEQAEDWLDELDEIVEDVYK